MGCRKLYLEDMKILQAAAVVVNCTARGDGGYDVETDRTPLFPEGGGQRSDIGCMNGVKILHCREENGTVIHQTEAPFEVGETVEIKVDGAVRRLHTQQHTGEHVLSFAYQQLFGAVNIGFHMSEDAVTIDLDKMLTAEEIAAGEAYANEMIWDDRTVTVRTVTAEEMRGLPLRKMNDKLEGRDIRIVAIDGGEMCTCCGTHFESTAPVGMIKVLEHIKYKQGCRITFVCGALALQWFAAENAELRRTAAKLSVKPDGVYDAVLRKEEQIAAVHAVLREKNAQLASFYAAEISKQSRACEGRRIAAGFVPADADTVKRVAETLCTEENTLAVLFYADGRRYKYFCMAGENCTVNCRDVAAKINPMLNAKGGGNPKTAQGSFEKTDEQVLQKVIEAL